MTIHLLQETLQIRRLLQEVLNLVSFYLTVCLPSSTLTRNCVLSCAISCAILCNIPCYPVKSCECCDILWYLCSIRYPLTLKSAATSQRNPPSYSNPKYNRDNPIANSNAKLILLNPPFIIILLNPPFIISLVSTTLVLVFSQLLYYG